MEIMLAIVLIGFLSMCYITFSQLRNQIAILEKTRAKQNELIEKLSIQNEDLYDFKYRVIGTVNAKATIIKKYDTIKELVDSESN